MKQFEQLMKKLINISNNNIMIKTSGTGRYQIDMSELDISDEIFIEWLRNRGDEPLAIRADNMVERKSIDKLRALTEELQQYKDKFEDLTEVCDTYMNEFKQKELEQTLLVSSIQKEIKSNHNKFSTINKRNKEIRKQTGNYTSYIGVFYINAEVKTGQVINSPLLLFPITLNFSATDILIYHNTDRPIVENSSMLLALKINLGYTASYKETEGEQLSDFVSDYDAYSDIISGLGDCKYGSGGFKLNRMRVEAKQKHLGIYTGAVIGVFDTSNSIYNDYKKLNDKDNKLILKLFNGSESLAVETVNKLKGEYTLPKWRTNELNLVSQLDQSQEYAVFMADKADSLVIYGPPGTGKSQVILNIIADQASKGKKVLLVSQKLTALMVIFNRLENLRSGAMLIEDSGSSRKEFVNTLAGSLSTLTYRETTVIKNKIEEYAHKIDELIQKLELIHSMLTSPLEPAGIDISFMYKNSKPTSENEEVVLKLIQKYSDIFNYSLKEIYTSCENIRSNFVQQAYENYINMGDAIRFSGISRIGLLHYVRLSEDILKLRIERADIDSKRHKGITSAALDGEYKYKLKLIDTANGLCDKIYEKDYCIDKHELADNYNEVELEKEISKVCCKLNDINFGTKTLTLNASVFNITNISNEIIEYVEESNLDKTELIKKILDYYGVNIEEDTDSTEGTEGTGNKTEDINLGDINIEDINLGDINIEDILSIDKALKKLILDREVLLKQFKLSSNDDIYNNIIELIENEYKHRISVVTQCLSLYEGLKVDLVYNLTVEDCHYILDNIHSMCPSKKTFMYKLLNRNNEEDKVKLAKLCCSLKIIEEIRNYDGLAVSKQIESINTEIDNIRVKLHRIGLKIKQLSISNIDNMHILFKEAIIYWCKNNLDKIAKEKNEMLTEVKTLTELKLSIERDPCSETIKLASILGVENNLKRIKDSLYSVIERTEAFISEQKYYTKRMISIDSEESKYLDEITNIGIEEASESSIEHVKKIINNRDSIEIVESLSDKDKLLLQISYTEGFEISEIVNGYLFYCIDKLENMGIHQNILIRYKEYISTIDKLEIEKVKLTSQLIEANISHSVTNSLNIGKLTTIQKELKGGRSSKSIRQLMSEYSEFMYEMFPIWLMTPETVSEVLHLEKDVFDMVIFDEASQLFIERTIPSLYRAKKAIVAGDDKQLKPTSFFISKQSDEYEYDEPGVDKNLGGISLLDQAKTTFSSVKLSFHYRSKYSELIQFSNYAFYNSLLKICPNTMSQKSTHTPIEYIKINGIVESHCNQLEAEYTANLVKDIITDTNYSGKSIGIVTFNIKQKECIDDKIAEIMNETCDDARAKFNEILNRETNGEDTSLFVKNLEDIQGDERDIIIFSLGYGYDISGKLHANLGPLRLEGGENRLNVAISRAKEKEYIIASINPEELKVENSKHIGPKLFKEFLIYARAISDNDYDTANKITKAPNYNSIADKKFDSPFEEDVFNGLVELGWKVETQVGVRGYRIDLAVYDDANGVYLAGIECDGATYHSSKYAKERDISRQRFLEGKGWIILRIWSRDWWHNSKVQLDIINNKLLELQCKHKAKLDKQIMIPDSSEPNTTLSDILMKNNTTTYDSSEQEHNSSEPTYESSEPTYESSEPTYESSEVTYESSETELEVCITTSETMYEAFSTFDITILDKSSIKGKKLRGITINEKPEKCKAWWEVVKHALYYRMQTMSVKDLCNEPTVYVDCIIIKLLAELNYPAWIVTDKTSIRNPVQILNSSYYMDVTGDAFGLVKRAIKLIDDKEQLIYCTIQ